jgi:hypothetical protein
MQLAPFYHVVQLVPCLDFLEVDGFFPSIYVINLFGLTIFLNGLDGYCMFILY